MLSIINICATTVCARDINNGQSNLAQGNVAHVLSGALFWGEDVIGSQHWH